MPRLLFNYGVALRHIGKLDEAATAFRRAVAIDRSFAEAWFNLGNAEFDRREFGPALTAFETAHASGPDSIELQNNWGIALSAAGRAAEAIDKFRRALEIDPDDVRSYANLGNARAALGHWQEAIDAYQNAVRREPDYGEAHYNLGNAYRQLNEFSSAIICYRTALAIDGENRNAATNLGLALQRRGRLEEALDVLAPLAATEGATPREQANAANILRDLGRFDEALKALDDASNVAAEDASLYNDLALALQHAGRTQDAIDVFAAGHALDPDNEVLASNRAQSLLAAGRFEEGWHAFEARLDHPEFQARAASLPGGRWQGEQAADATLMVDCEQGIGDAIQFARYLPQARERVGRLLLRCAERLVPLMSGLAGSDEIVTPAQRAEADLWVPLLSLPHVMELGVPDEMTEAYLSVAESRVAQWRDRLGPGLKIGLNWRGNPAYERDYARSVPVSTYEPFSAIEGVRFISLAEPAPAGEEAPPWMATLGDEVDADGAFIDTAAILHSLDLIITTDTALPHIAGALGRPVWMLTASAPDWRWAGTGSITPWYASLRLVRQPHPAEWAAPANRMAEMLTRWVRDGGDPLAVIDAETSQ